MSGNQMLGNQIIQIQQPDRQAMFAKLISDMVGRSSDIDKVNAAQSQDQQAAIDKEMAAQFLKLPADQQAANFGKLSDGAKQHILNTAEYAPHTPTPEEVAQQNYGKFLQSQSQDFTTPANYDPSKVALFNDKLGGSKPLFDYQGSRFNYQDANQLPAGTVAAQRVGDKLDQSANEQVTTAETQRNHQAEESQTGPLRKAQGFEATSKGQEALAGIPLKQAQTQAALNKGGDGGLSAQDKINQVLNDPTGNTWHEMLKSKDPDVALVANGLRQQGYSIPNKGSGTEGDRLVGAQNALSILDGMDSIAQKWRSRGISLNGRATGVANNLGNSFLGGATTFTVPEQYKAEYAQDVAKISDYKQMLAGAEARAALGRANQQYVNQLMKTLPDLSNSDEKWDGSSAAARNRAKAIQGAVLKTIWGNKVPPQAMAALAQTPNAEAPELTAAAPATVINYDAKGNRQ